MGYGLFRSVRCHAVNEFERCYIVLCHYRDRDGLQIVLWYVGMVRIKIIASRG
jgi:hypothetical protein